MAQPRGKRLEMEDRRRKVAHLYLSRVPQTEIAAQLGIAQSTVCTDIQAVLASYRKERHEHIDREVADLEQMERDCAVQFRGTKNREWVSERRAIKERRAKLLGLDAQAEEAPIVGRIVVEIGRAAEQQEDAGDG